MRPAANVEVRSAILRRVLTLVSFMVPNDTPCRGAHSTMTGHMTRYSPDYCAFNAPLGVCRGTCSDGHSQYDQCNEHFHCGSP
jgi:hypothetical protein